MAIRCYALERIFAGMIITMGRVTPTVSRMAPEEAFGRSSVRRRQGKGLRRDPDVVHGDSSVYGGCVKSQDALD